MDPSAVSRAALSRLSLAGFFLLITVMTGYWAIREQKLLTLGAPVVAQMQLPPPPPAETALPMVPEAQILVPMKVPVHAEVAVGTTVVLHFLLPPSARDAVLIMRGDQAVFSPPLLRLNTSGAWFSFILDLPGIYDADLLLDRCEGAPVTLTLQAVGHRDWFPTVPCSPSPRIRSGRWVNCKNVPSSLPCADGWVWMPYECYYDQRSLSTLAALRPVQSRPLWIFMAGDSRVRGLYHTMLQMILPAMAADSLTSSPPWKTWGTLDYQSADLRMTWRDLRNFNSPLDNQHGENVAMVEADFFKLWHDGNVTPDVIVAQNGWSFLSPTALGSTLVIALEGWNWTNVYRTGYCYNATEVYVRPANPRAETVALANKWSVLETDQILTPMYRELCTEYDVHHIHMHRACGRHIAGTVNQMTAKLIVSLLAGLLGGGVNRTAGQQAAPRQQQDYRICRASTPTFTPRYAFSFPPLTCSPGLVSEEPVQPCDRAIWNGCSMGRSYLWQLSHPPR